MEKFKKVMSNFGSAIAPMLGYNAANILFGGSTYIISLYFLSYLTEVEGLSTKQAGLVFAFRVANAGNAIDKAICIKICRIHDAASKGFGWVIARVKDIAAGS